MINTLLIIGGILIAGFLFWKARNNLQKTGAVIVGIGAGFKAEAAKADATIVPATNFLFLLTNQTKPPIKITAPIIKSIFILLSVYCI